MILTCPRYITENEITIIAQDYRHGTGYAGREIRDFYTAANRAPDRLERLERLERTGGSQTEFGEKPSRNRLEFRLRYFFWRLETRPAVNSQWMCD